MPKPTVPELIESISKRERAHGYLCGWKDATDVIVDAFEKYPLCAFMFGDMIEQLNHLKEIREASNFPYETVEPTKP